MKAGCAAQKLQFEAHGKRDVVADFDGGRMTSDGGGLLLREANCCLGDLMARLGQCVSDFRQQGSVEHTATDLIAQRVCALALGYEDLNDHGTLRCDSAGQCGDLEALRAGPSGDGRPASLPPDAGGSGRPRQPAGGPVPGVAGGSAGGDLAGPGRDRRPGSASTRTRGSAATGS